MEITLKTFEKLALKTNSFKKFLKEVREIKNVPPKISLEFFEKYGKGGFSPEDAAEKFYKKVKNVN